MSSIYTEKWVLFLDILGFEAYINDEKKSEMLAEKILLVINKATKIPSISKIPMCISQFSDTFVVSCDDLHALNLITIIMQAYLLSNCLLSRGAITYGKVFHNGSQFIGPAINRAYNLEKLEAIYPRVIIDPECEQHPSVRSLFDANTYSANILKDYDGYLYINFLTQFRKFDDIEKLFKQYNNTKHRGKYTWLKQKADEFVQNTK